MKAQFPPKLAGETKTYTFDYTGDLAIGETIVSASVAATVWSGNDATPGGVISGLSTVASPQVTQKITAGVPGTIYKLLCTAVSSAGNTLQGYALLAVLGDLV